MNDNIPKRESIKSFALVDIAEKFTLLFQIPIIVGLVVIMIFLQGEIFTMDLRQKFGAEKLKNQLSEEVVVIDLNDETIYLDFIQKNLSFSPLDRNYLDSLINTIETYNPSVIGIDILLEAPSSDVRIDNRLKNTFNTFSNIIIGTSIKYYENKQNVELGPLPIFLEKYTLTGFVDLEGTRLATGAKKTRQYSLVQDASGETIPSFSLIVLLSYLINIENFGKKFDNSEFRNILGKKNISEYISSSPVDWNRIYTGKHYINYVSPNLLVVSAKSVLDRFIKPDLLNGKIVLIGSSASLLNDFLDTPVGKIPGLYAHAYILENLLDDNMLIFPSLRLRMITSSLFLILIILLNKIFNLKKCLILIWVFLLSYWLLAFIIFYYFPATWLPLNGPSAIVFIGTSSVLIWRNIDLEGRDFLKTKAYKIYSLKGKFSYRITKKKQKLGK